MPTPCLIHHPDYDAASVPDGHRFPMRKYSSLAARLRAAGERFLQPHPADAALLALAHAPSYVDAVLSQTLDRRAARRIGFEITPAIAARSRASSAGTLLAGRIALDQGSAVNLAGGSHHADRDGGAGFCVFNDVAVAACALIAEGHARRIAIIDLDVHHGDGTARIFADEPAVFTFSMHCEANWPLNKPPSDLDVGLAAGTGDEAYLDTLAAHLPAVFDAARPDLVFYNAGVDPHEDDRLGRLALSDAGLKARDSLVAEACRARGVPVAGVLGGGYGTDPDVIARRHLFMVEALLEIETAPPL